MRVSIITDGDAEYKTLPILYSQLQARSGHVLLKPLKVNVTGIDPPAKIVKECSSRLIIAKAMKADCAIVLLDREQDQRCPGLIASLVEGELANFDLPTRVVLKDRMYESWLVADVVGLQTHPKRFKLSKAAVKRIDADKADRCDAIELLRAAAQGKAYDKVPDAQRLCAALDVARAASNSRSLRHLLHALGDPVYSKQCRVPQ